MKIFNLHKISQNIMVPNALNSTVLTPNTINSPEEINNILKPFFEIIKSSFVNFISDTGYFYSKYKVNPLKVVNDCKMDIINKLQSNYISGDKLNAIVNKHIDSLPVDIINAKKLNYPVSDRTEVVHYLCNVALSRLSNDVFQFSKTRIASLKKHIKEAIINTKEKDNEEN